MSLTIHIETSDRQEAEGLPGLLVTMRFRTEEQSKTLALERIVTLSDEMEIATVAVIRDELGLGDHLARHLLHAGAQTSWKAIYRHDLVVVGFVWQGLPSWLDQIDGMSIATIESLIEGCLARMS